MAVICGVTVLTWTANQTVSYLNPRGSIDLEMLRRTKGLIELALEQGILAGLTPLRDLCGLGDTLPLLVVAAALVFRLAADRRGGMIGPYGGSPPSGSGWTTFTWGGAWLYVLYRLAAMFDPGELPLGQCLFFEVAVVPPLMVLSDGLLLAWVLVELRNAGLGGAGVESLDVEGALALVPGASLACLAALPARAAGTGMLLAFLNMPSYANGVPPGEYQRLGWGLIGLQGLALSGAGLVGAVAWGRGGLGGSIRGYARLLSAEGGHLVAVLALGGLAAGTLATLAYALVLSLPQQPWVLTAADSYAHYATLPVGLVTLSALVELGERCLPLARIAEAGGAAASDP